MEKYLQVANNEYTLIYQLNDSDAAKDLLSSLPFNGIIENFSNNEKIVHLSKQLRTSNTPSASHGINTLGYFKPWNNIIFYYGDFGPYPELFQIGTIVQGQEYIKHLYGVVEITEFHE